VKRQHVVKNSFVPILIGLFLMTGCAPPPRGGEPIGKIQDAFRPEQSARQEAKIPLPPPEIRSALLPSARTLDLGSEEPAEARFDIAASQVPAREFFMSLVQGSRFNMVVHPEVSGEITIDLKNTTVQEVLQVVHNVYGYPYFSTGNIYQVMPIGLRAQTFQVNYLNLIRKGQSQTRVSSGQVTQGGTSKNDQGSQSNENKNSTVSGSSIETASVADFWGELRNAIQSLVGTEGGRKVVVQPQASVVVVVAMPDELQLVGEYLRTVQSNLQRQVVIEAKVIEVSLGDGFQTGINWAALGKPGGGKTILAGQSGGGSVFSKGVSESAGNSGNLTPGQALPDGLDSLAFGGLFSLAVNFNDFQAFIEMLQSQGDVQVLSSPRISTVNNQKAVIKVGSDEFFITDISTDTTTGSTTNNNSTDITLTPFFSGIALDVTPQIDPTGQITLHIHPTVSEVTDQTKEFNVSGVDQTIPVAFSTVRESDSIVHAESGQLVVIGGLMQEKTVNNEDGVPLLSKIPGIGGLFRHTQASSSKSELVILLRPQVISSPGDWERNLEASRQRIERLSPEFNRNW